MSARINNVAVGRVGLGLMNFTWGQTVPREEAFDAIKTAVDSGANYINSCEFYGPPDDLFANVKLLRAFFDQYPEYKAKVIVGIKGAVDTLGRKLSGELEFLRQDIKGIQAALGDTKLDVFVVSRVPSDVSTEILMANLATLQSEGLFGCVGLSEVTAATLRKAHAIHPVALVENELSLFNLEEEALDVVKACDELGIVYTAYSPLGRGMLVQRYKTFEELPPDDNRRKFPRFQGENFAKNLELGDKVREIADKKGVTVAQLGLAFILGLSKHVVALQGSTSSERILENLGASDVQLEQDDVDAVQGIVDSFNIQGSRYPAFATATLMK